MQQEKPAVGMVDLETKFVGHKLSQVSLLEHGGLSKHNIRCVVGSYDNVVNYVTVWSFPDEASAANDEMQKCCQLEHTGDVLGLDTNQDDLIVSGSSTGDVNLYRANQSSGRFQALHCWKALHSHVSGSTAPCTSVAVESQIVTCGEDGSINILDINRLTPSKQMPGCDSSTLTSIIWQTHQTVAAVNTVGQLKIFDLRENQTTPSQTFVLSGDLSILNCLAKHPSQNHLLATGSYNGILGIYDMRQDSVPITMLEAHNGKSINDIKFHDQQPDNLLTCSADGSVWHWNGAAMSRAGDTGQSSWLLADAAKHRVEVTDLNSSYGVVCSEFEVNSIDFYGDIVVCGTDGEVLRVFYGVSMA